ncbi:MAG: hypothetical protein V1806_04670 [Pseudomonadota bacterium]
MPPRRRLTHWLPRLLLLVFAVGLFLPLPRYLRGLGREEYLVWLSQVLWVLGLLLAAALGVALAWWWRRRRRR